MSVAVVTGGASGIGLATVREFVSASHFVHVIDIDEKALEACQSEFGSQSVVTHCKDVSELQTWKDLSQVIGGELDVLVHNALFVKVQDISEQEYAHWRRHFDVMLDSVFFSVQMLRNALKDSHGSLVLVSSVHSGIGLPGHSAYAAVKGGLISLGRQLAVEFGPEIRVNTVIPGPIMTQVWQDVDQTGITKTIESTVLKRMGTPADVAAAIAFLSSGKAAYITGAELVIDGGWSIGKSSS
jgi:NAD(P)-dependent dehydrogenase (short-subunit alcohol dehydrogenase family)